MNRLDVQTIGWVITRDVCVEASRLALGARPRTRPATVALLARAWMQVRRSMVTDRFAETPTGFLLSTLSERAVSAFLRLLVSSYPGMYSVRALRDRCARTLVCVIACAACVYVIEHYSAPSNPIAGVALALLYATGSWSAIDLVQLLRAYVLIAHLQPIDSWRITP